jgi:hypothetical protein
MPRWTIGVVALFISIASCTGTTDIPQATSSSSSDVGVFPRRLDVGGYFLWMDCSGEGSPTVVLENGSGLTANDWDRLLASGIDGTTRVCVYERAGNGASDPRPSDDPLTTGTLAEELHTLLAEANESPPYVLVGLSFGGLIVRSFEGHYPDEVAGIVLEDSSSEWQFKGRFARSADWERTPDGHIDTRRTVADLRNAGSIDTPFIVVSAGRRHPDQPVWSFRLWQSYQRRLAQLSDTAVHVIAERAQHVIHFDDPAVMKAAIALVVDAAREGTPLGPCPAGFEGLDVSCAQRVP